jgi:hypothetical protein
MLSKLSIYQAILLAIILSLLPGAGQASVTVTTTSELISAIENTASGGDTDIRLEDGTYTLSGVSMLWVSANNVSVSSVSGNRNAVIIQGQGMYGGVGWIFNVAGDNFKVSDITMRRVANHAIQFQPQADGPTISNCIIQDTYEQMLKGSFNSGSPNQHSDNGLVENCLFEYTAGIGPNYYIGGIDVHRGHNWIVRGCTFKNIKSPAADIAEHAIHFWNGSENITVERNLILNCDRGIGFGMAGNPGNVAGVIRNNMIYHDGSGAFADVGIIIEDTPDCDIYNNTIYMAGSYPNAIEYRWSGTTGTVIVNNLTNKAIQLRDGASHSVLSNNVTNAQTSWFIDASIGDLHLVSSVSAVVDQGIFISGLTNDFDGDVRPHGAGYDIGADEYGALPPQPPPAATLVSPSGGISDPTPEFIWNEVTDSSWYYLWIDGPSGNVHKRWYEVGNTITCSVGICSVTPSMELPGGDYIWWVQTWNTDGYGPWSTSLSFSLPTEKPPATTLVSPSGSISIHSPTYTWNAVDNATWYYLWVSDSDGDPVIRQWYRYETVCSGDTCAVTHTTALSNGNHRWWIQTWNPNGYGPWSAGIPFGVNTPGKATLVSPAGNIYNGQPTYTWNAVSDATWYYLWVDDDSGNIIRQWYQDGMEIDCTGGTCAVTPSEELTPGIHTWWIQTWSPVGYGPWSDGVSFEYMLP